MAHFFYKKIATKYIGYFNYSVCYTAIFFPGYFLKQIWWQQAIGRFSDMDLPIVLISHKTAKNGIPAVRTNLLDSRCKEFTILHSSFAKIAVVFSLM